VHWDAKVARTMDVEFGPYRLERQRRLVRGPDGIVHLSARSFDILALLLGRPSEVVSKDEILAAVWPGSVVEENTVQVHVSALRKALEAGMISTVHGRGYKYAGPTPVALNGAGSPEVHPGADPLMRSAMEALSEPGFRRGWVDPQKQSVAVLPFTNMSGDAEQEYFADGITEDVITELSRFRNLFVISRNSSFHFKGKSPKAQEVGQELAARYVVEGSVRKAGQRVRITAQLVETETGIHLWAERFDRDLSDIFSVQDEVVRAIVSAIPGEVSRQVLEQARRKHPGNLTAYECNLQGRYAFLHWSEGLSSAISWYERAVAADPGYAEAQAGLALMYAYSVYALGEDPELRFREARAHAAKAMASADSNYNIHRNLAQTYHLTGERDLALRHAERAVALNPNDAHVLQIMGEALAYSGRMQEALGWYERSQALEPYAPDDQRLDCICDTYYMLREYEKVVQIHSFYQSIPAFIDFYLAASLAQLGRMDDARKAIDRFYAKRLPKQDSIKLIRAQNLICSRQEDRDHWLDGFRKAGFDV
jgi:adenylate cyclase